MTKPAANHNAETPAVTIFIDLDGVLADFDTHAQAQGKIKADGKTDYDALDTEWWRTMPAFDGAVEFLKDLKKEGQTKFLTGPMVSPECHYGKAQWITNFEPGRGKWALMDLIICPSKDKRFLAAEDRILVDDRIGNIKDWEAAGGVGIHHTGDFADTLARTQKAAAKIRAAKTAKTAPANSLRRTFKR
jgi:5'(3')-deoxyribonucleotidase